MPDFQERSAREAQVDEVAWQECPPMAQSARLVGKALVVAVSRARTLGTAGISPSPTVEDRATQ
jgi:hypothetical protein